jgi:hypothetical protein
MSKNVLILSGYNGQSICLTIRIYSTEWLTMQHGKDPLDLFEDDDDGVIETILLFDDEEEKPAQTKSGCVIPLMLLGLATGGSIFGMIKLLV